MEKARLRINADTISDLIKDHLERDETDAANAVYHHYIDSSATTAGMKQRQGKLWARGVGLHGANVALVVDILREHVSGS